MLLRYLAVNLFLIIFRIDMCVGKIVFEEYHNTSPASGCTTPGGQRGNCERLTKCKTLIQKVKRWDQLRSYLCGFVGTEPKVCCPSSLLPRMSRSLSTELQTVGTAAFLVVLETASTTFLYGFSVPPKTNASAVDDNSDDEKPIFLPEDCGSSIYTNSRIIGGQESEMGSWPWIVVIFHIHEKGYRIYECAGSLVTDRHVITAAHCVVESSTYITLDPKRIMVRLGVHDLINDNDPKAVNVGVDAVQIHELYDFRNHNNDIAVVHLNQSITFSSSISPICLPYNSLRYEDLSGKKSTVIRFGETSVDGTTSDVLMEVSFDILDQEECRRIYERDPPISSVQLCAGALDGSKHSCQVGESGGPLMILGKDNRYYLIGIVSFGQQCSESGYPGVYTRVTEFLDWLTPKLAD